MSHRKTAAMAAMAGAIVAAGSVVSPAAATTAGPAADKPAAKSAAAEDVRIQKVIRQSSKCTSPKGKKLNISWQPASESITVYFNNHCNQRRTIRVWYHFSGKHRDVKVNAHTKGHKRLWHNTWGSAVKKITFPR